MTTSKINTVETQKNVLEGKSQKNVVEIKLPETEVKTAATVTPLDTPVLVVLEWDRTAIDMGVVAPGSKQKYEFNYLGTKKITDVKASCGCTSTIKNGNTISGVWTIGSDYSAVKEVESLTTRTVTITFGDASKQVLTLKATVNKMYKIQK